jgi:dihydroorotate dehydrogenase
MVAQTTNEVAERKRQAAAGFGLYSDSAGFQITPRRAAAHDMSWLYRNTLRPAFFTQDPETVHHFTMRWLGHISRHETLCGMLESFCGADALPIELFGLRFPNPVGLAAGMDKSAEAVPAWQALGFGHAELGAVTWHGQPGNPKPRIFRSPPTEAIINRMGFNNPGTEAVAQTLEQWRAHDRWPRHPIGINLGKSKITELSDAPQDYANSFRRLHALADFFVVNVSSPNTPNLRQLQDKSALDEILAAMQEVNASFRRSGAAKPILVKVAPDLTFEALDEILALVQSRQLAGLVATNTTIARPDSENLTVRKAYAQTGGLSGKPVRARSTEIIRHLYRQSSGRVPIIGVGGIFNPEDAWEKITAGASLVQLYTGFIYEGPTLPRRIVGGLREKLAQHGLRNSAAAVGMQHR